MTRLAYSIAAFAAATLTAAAAQAATYINYSPVGSDGGFTITFGNTGITDTNFSDVFEFTMPDGTADFTITSTASAGTQKITWSDVAFNDSPFDSVKAGPNEFNFLNGVKISVDGQQRLVLTGVSGGNASYSGVISFIPGAIPGLVPEPESWALMILGFGGAGGLIRLRRAKAALAA